MGFLCAAGYPAAGLYEKEGCAVRRVLLPMKRRLVAATASDDSFVFCHAMYACEWGLSRLAVMHDCAYNDVCVC